MTPPHAPVTYVICVRTGFMLNYYLCQAKNILKPVIDHFYIISCDIRMPQIYSHDKSNAKFCFQRGCYCAHAKMYFA
jgi:hypothetical protein